MLKFSLKTAAILSLSSCLLLSGCGLKAGLYLPQRPSATIPVESTPIERTSDDGAAEKAPARGETAEPAPQPQR